MRKFMYTKCMWGCISKFPEFIYSFDCKLTECIFMFTGVGGHLGSVEGLTLGAETAWSVSSSIVDDAHRLVSLVARQLNLIVLNNILLDDSLSRLLALRLVDDSAIKIDGRNEAIVAWNVLGHLGRANAQVINFVVLLGGVVAHDIAWVVAFLTEGISEFGEVSAARRTIRLSIDGPERSARFDFVHGVHLVINIFL